MATATLIFFGLLSLVIVGIIVWEFCTQVIDHLELRTHT